ncbi:hypothetical protein MNBD_GAMMA26-671 [hydrothermal vent metagenome]|uniref:Periplasmic nitrate reductase component NapD n=1 Tax=hydrothermal vent metagenome TaxID=652676 RepID=A0A3B1BQD9_9ZZZZ
MNNEQESVGCIVGAVIQLKPNCTKQQYEKLLEKEGLEIHAQGDQQRLVVTLETDTDGEMIETIEDIQNMNSVLNIYTVYHHLDEFHNETEGWTWR